MDTGTRNEDSDEQRQLDDDPADDRGPRPGLTVDICWRCANCWGPVSRTTDAEGRWNRIWCRVCGHSVDGDNAAQEADAMRREAAANMAAARVGRPAKYRAGASFVLKLVPDMDRDKGKMDRRVEASLAKGRKRWRLTRHDIPPGGAGKLYAEARALLGGIDNLSAEKSAIALSDLEFGEPQVVNIDRSPADGTLHVTGKVPVVHRKPSNHELMGRMGSALVSGMAAAFACEVGMKAILVTRLDEAAKTHDLLELYGELPADSRQRLAGDFPTIAEVLDHSREIFGKWRYFEQSADGRDILGLVDTDRVWKLGKAARVIADECAVSGLRYDIDIETTLESKGGAGGMGTSERTHVSLKGDEAAVAWDEVLREGRDNR